MRREVIVHKSHPLPLLTTCETTIAEALIKKPYSLLETLVLISNYSQLNNAYNPTPVEVLVWN